MHRRILTFSIQRAEITERVIQVYFSHPLVSQIMHWTFFSSKFIPQNASKALVKSDGSLKLNGKVWLWLTKQHWTTRIDKKTDTSGEISLRGFMGDYEVQVSHSGKTKNMSFQLKKADGNITIKLN